MLVMLFLLCCAAPAVSDQETQARLKTLRERINHLEQTLSRDLANRDKLHNELRRTEIRIGQLAREARLLLAQQESAKTRLAELQSRQKELLSERQTHLTWLAQTVRHSYQVGREPLVKLLLNQQQPDQLARVLRYQEYFQKARTQRISGILATLEELRQVTQEVISAQNELTQRAQAVRQQSERLESARQARQQALGALQESMGQKQREISKLEEDAKRLDQLLKDMTEALSDIPANPLGQPFGALAGNLPWPAEGRQRVSYGRPREAGLTWNGVIIEVPEGALIRAIHPGRVVFAEWLRGYGLIIILDHGDGFLTLYGHNQSLLRDVGDWVLAGETLALAGDSGGRTNAGVYFEIRRNGSPVNPGRWCSNHIRLPPLAIGNQGP